MIINIITLGCSKNLVDSEHLLYQFKVNGYKVMHDETEKTADIVIINTCGFIHDAKQESVETILQYIEQKKRGHLKKLYVMGCLSERYERDLKKELPQVDGFYGVWDWRKILEDLGTRYHHELLTNRHITTPDHYAFLKISEGCNRTCAFCAIPGIRGTQQSVSIEKLSEEAENLVGNGAKELILIAQDLTNYGVDIYQKHALPELLGKLLKIDGLEWIRLHYAYPTGFPAEVIDMMANEERICSYLDIPIQHINNRILNEMSRGHDRAKLEKLLSSFRKKVPDVALRTTLLVGFPGETEEEFNELKEFIREFRFDRLGIFPYSHEEDTPSFGRLDSVPVEVKQQRVDEIMEIQQEISFDLNRNKTGKIFKVLIDREDPDFYIGRTQYDSPEVDNEVLIPNNKKLEVGKFYRVKITDAGEFDLYGDVI